MNKQIEKLVSQSFTDEQGERFDIEKFAELIVRECADIAYTAEPYVSGDNILKRFGLE